MKNATDAKEIVRSLSFEQFQCLIVVSKNTTTARVISDAEYRELAGLGLVIRTNGRADRLTDLGRAVLPRGRLAKKRKPTP